MALFLIIQCVLAKECSFLRNNAHPWAGCVPYLKNSLFLVLCICSLFGMMVLFLKIQCVPLKKRLLPRNNAQPWAGCVPFLYNSFFLVLRICSFFGMMALFLVILFVFLERPIGPQERDKPLLIIKFHEQSWSSPLVSFVNFMNNLVCSSFVNFSDWHQVYKLFLFSKI